MQHLRNCQCYSCTLTRAAKIKWEDYKIDAIIEVFGKPKARGVKP